MNLKKNGVAPIEFTQYSISSVECNEIRAIREDNTQLAIGSVQTNLFGHAFYAQIMKGLSI